MCIAKILNCQQSLFPEKNRGKNAKFTSFSFVLFPKINRDFINLHLLTMLLPFLSDQLDDTKARVNSPFGFALDCEQSLFCSKIRTETRKEELETTSACQRNMSRMPSRSFSIRIFEQKRDCSQSSFASWATDPQPENTGITVKYAYIFQ